MPNEVIASKNEYENRVRRLADELERMVNLIAWARECLENELIHTGLGYKKMGIGEKDLKKLKDLSVAMNAAVEARVKYDRAAKQLAEKMTPEEEFDSVIAYIHSLNAEGRDRVRRRMKEWNTAPTPEGGF